jgi:hypothetical protein
VTVADIESVSNNLTDLSDCWSISANFAYILSKSVLREVTSNDTDTGKSVVLSMEISRIIVMISPTLAPVLPRVTVPPEPNSKALSLAEAVPVIEYWDVELGLALYVSKLVPLYTFMSLVVKNSNGMVKAV